MRQIGSIEDRQQAERFVAYLIGKRIPCSFDGGDSSWRIWIQEEDDVATAKTELDQFRADPNHERYRNAVAQAEIVLRQQLLQAKEISRRTIDLRDRWARPTIYQGPATVALMALMVAVGFLTGLEPVKHEELTRRLIFSNYPTMREIWSGEVWRLVSPIFLHFGIFHFLFNIMALRDLGLLVESRIGTIKFIALVLVIAVVSNYAQFAMGHGIFGGMSGVVYGLFGYAWIRGRLEPSSGLSIPQTAVTYMIGWFFLCIFLIPNVANWAHAGGLVAGAALGAFTPALNALRRR